MGKVNVKLMGGLGNYLFQIAAAYCYSLEHNKELVITYNDSVKVHQNVLTYTDNILHNLNMLPNVNLSNYTVYQEPYFHYQEIPHIDGNTHLSGYFQSEKYFLNRRDKLKQLFTYPEHIITDIKGRYRELLNSKTCSLHVRRGDYLTKPDVHPTQSIEYYKESISHMDEDCKLLIFSDDIKWCKSSFEGVFSNIEFIEGNSDYIDLLLMSLCDNNIICNSSFSWWGAWLNQNENKIVVSPKNWFGPALGDYDIKDLIPSTWYNI